MIDATIVADVQETVKPIEAELMESCCPIRLDIPDATEMFHAMVRHDSSKVYSIEGAIECIKLAVNQLAVSACNLGEGDNRKAEIWPKLTGLLQHINDVTAFAEVLNNAEAVEAGYFESFDVDYASDPAEDRECVEAVEAEGFGTATGGREVASVVAAANEITT